MYLLQKKQNFKKKLQKKREIRVFVSSTFKDFYKERDEIIKKTFREVIIIKFYIRFVWLVYGVDQYFSYIVAVSFIGGGNQSSWRKPQTCR